MAQNRQGIKDRLDATHDYEVNLKAELEILSLHDKIDELREMKWAELITMQQEQIRLLTQLITERAVATDRATPDAPAGRRVDPGTDEAGESGSTGSWASR